LVHNFQLNESFSKYCDGFLDLLHQLLHKESENVGIIVMKIVMDWHRYFKGSLESKVPPFIDFVRSLYDNMHLSIQEHFHKRSSSARIDIETDEEPDVPATRSFRVLAEAPIDIVILFQLHRKWMTENIGLILPNVVKVCL
jgi:transformation/transcription domain-associated protein